MSDYYGTPKLADEEEYSLERGSLIIAFILAFFLVLVCMRYFCVIAIDLFCLCDRNAARRDATFLLDLFQRFFRDSEDLHGEQQQENGHDDADQLRGMTKKERAELIKAVLQRQTFTAEHLKSTKELSSPSETSDTLTTNQDEQEKIKEFLNDGSHDTTCSICLQDFEIGGAVVSSKSCCHIFHENCLSQWLEKNTGCPYCRVDMITHTYAQDSQTDVSELQ